MVLGGESPVVVKKPSLMLIMDTFTASITKIIRGMFMRRGHIMDTIMGPIMETTMYMVLMGERTSRVRQ